MQCTVESDRSASSMNQVEPKFKDKPSAEVIERYSKKLENFLALHNITVNVELYDHPVRIESYIDNDLFEIVYHWIGDIAVSNSEIGTLNIHLTRDGIEEDIADKSIWYDAVYIQDHIYNHLKKVPNLPPQDNDPYWKLWDYLPEISK